ncbi:unnamed protein product [Didymodactylos carnosus]|uniref:Uncharacterized protein n=1 Tax=Didymodactylos carnosus TaxID=1234261 RepID=A0A815G9R9_9BILA|nr:unnamed protein product [Didymodactylos carnosus]CAF4194184.1 unnamed protein product [Didymodactylos carnosus]
MTLCVLKNNTIVSAVGTMCTNYNYRKVKEDRDLNNIDERNLTLCKEITANCQLHDIFDRQPYLVDIFENYTAQKLHGSSLFFCFMVSVMHWSDESKLYKDDSNDYVPPKLFGILRGASVSNKSKYIKTIREAFAFVERYYRDELKVNGDFHSSCIEDVTDAKLTDSLEKSVFERRAADLIERISCVFQNIFDIIEICEATPSIKLGEITKQNLTGIQIAIGNKFYKQDLATQSQTANYDDIIDLKELDKVIINSVRQPPNLFMACISIEALMPKASMVNASAE